MSIFCITSGVTKARKYNNKITLSSTGILKDIELSDSQLRKLYYEYQAMLLENYLEQLKEQNNDIK